METKRKKYKIIYQNERDRQKYINRLSIIEGQIRGIIQMIKEDRFCFDILIQISSVENGLKSLYGNIIENQLRTCVTDEFKKGNCEVIDEIVDIIKKMK